MTAQLRSTALMAEVVYVGATRPPMRWGVTLSAMLFNLVFTVEGFLLTRNLWSLLLCVPIHALSALLCLRDARFFDLALLWARTRVPALLANHRFWGGSSYSPLSVRLPDRLGRRGETRSVAWIAPVLVRDP